MTEDYIVEHRPKNLADTCAIDFEVRDAESDSLLATVWGDSLDDLQVDCEHTDIEYDDDETVGECLICGDTCNWHTQIEVVDGYTTKERVPHEWLGEKLGGFIKEYLDKEYKK